MLDEISLNIAKHNIHALVIIGGFEVHVINPEKHTHTLLYLVLYVVSKCCCGL